MARLYSLTDAGRKAWDTQDGRVPLECRRVLGLVGQDTEPRDLCARLGLSETAVTEILKEMEESGLVKSIGTGLDSSNLDFTDQFSLAEIQAAQQRAREELDFTGALKTEDLRAGREKK